MKYEQQRAVEMTGYGKRGKPKAGFPSFPTALGNRKRRDSHIPTAPARRGKVENQTPGFPLSRLLFIFSERRFGGRFAPPSGSFFDYKMLQALHLPVAHIQYLGGVG